VLDRRPATTYKSCALAIQASPAVFDVTPQGLHLREIAAETSVEALKKLTEPPFKTAETLKTFAA
jgi:acyl CoA:acetate/3-ketoacid CoA transferase beta subunit